MIKSKSFVCVLEDCELRHRFWFDILNDDVKKMMHLIAYYLTEKHCNITDL